LDDYTLQHVAAHLCLYIGVYAAVCPSATGTQHPGIQKVFFRELVSWSGPIEQRARGLSVKILRQAVRIASWVYARWRLSDELSLGTWRT
jgi:hypothetical protein